MWKGAKQNIKKKDSSFHSFLVLVGGCRWKNEWYKSCFDSVVMQFPFKMNEKKKVVRVALFYAFVHVVKLTLCFILFIVHELRILSRNT